MILLIITRKFKKQIDRELKFTNNKEKHILKKKIKRD